MNLSTNNQLKTNVCLQGYGIVCGLTVHINATCDIEIGAGMTITATGMPIEIPNKSFSYYLREPSKVVQQYFPHDFGDKNRSNRTVLELTEGNYDPKRMDSLKQQNPKDLPTRDLLDTKILVILIDENNQIYFLLINPTLLLEKSDKLKQVKELAKNEITETRTGLFKRPQKTTVSYSNEVIKLAFYPYLQLPEVYVPRFGYKKLAIKDSSQPFGTNNFVNPFTKITSFKNIFDEYKAILDDLVSEFETVLEKLHDLYGDQLTHKGRDYWTTYRNILVQKWQNFLEEGEQLYYIQYFYDWLVDLVKAYDELREELAAFVGGCHCEGVNDKSDFPTIIQLGPVLGGRTSYTPVLFRDYFQPPMIDGSNAEHWNEIRFLHWRMMMMIWTFDLPQLRLDEKVLVKNGYIIPAKEFEDSTNYFEKLDVEHDNNKDLEEVPIKLTPSQKPDTKLGEQAIPCYYPLDADSPYSLHQYWNYRLTQMHRTKHIRSFNAIVDSDSYTILTKDKYHKDSQFSLAFNLRDYPFLRAEGHIGKLFSTENTIAEWFSLIGRYNLTMNVIAKNVSELTKMVSKEKRLTGVGLEHIGGLEQGQTLVLVYAATGEQIELNECKKDKSPEIEAQTIVADFTLPLNSI